MGTMICSVAGCGRLGKKHAKTGGYYLLKGMCNMHYQRKVNNSKFPRGNRMQNPLYRRYRNMINRCYNTKSPRYEVWGGRGIKVYSAWRDLMSGFELYAAYVSELPNAFLDGHSVDRIDNNGNYEPGNLRWATASVQNKNRRPFKRENKIDP